ncbi:terminase small subunit [Cupriavidus necator]|uniref:terminase small subunit n=1 Tax=Cupriavidus necator TaxID=106590 RepID=UPI003ECC89FC
MEPEPAPAKPAPKKPAARKTAAKPATKRAPDTRKRPAGKKVPKVRKATSKPASAPEVLTEKAQRFVDEYIIDLNGTQAAIRAGYSTRSARAIAAENLTKPSIVAAIQAAMDARAERTQITADQVLRRWHQIAFADANELIEYRRVCCRHCHGTDHQYQWVDEAEFQRVLTRILAEAEPDKPQPALPTADGGFGFDTKADPHEGCPECHGEGHGVPHIHDTRKLKPGARALYAGVKITKDGIEVKMHDPAKALENIARHLKMFVDKTEIDITKKPSEMTDEEIDAAIAARAAALQEGDDA